MLAEIVKPFTTWMHLHPHMAGLIAFAIAFAESLAFIGGIIPGSVMMTAIGILIGSGVIPIWSTFIWAIMGAILGDGLSYWIGHHFKDHLRVNWPFRKYPHWLEKGEQFFHRHGGKSIFIGRFIGPIRSILPVVAGMLHMPIKRFLIADIVSAIAWAPAYMIPGILLGAASLELDPETATRLVLLVLLILIIVWMLTWLIKFSSLWLIKKTDRLLNRTWNYLRQHKTVKPLTVLLQDPSHPAGHGQLGLALFCLLTALLFIGLAIAVDMHTAVIHFNQPLFNFLQSVRTPSFDKFIVMLTFFGEKNVMLGFLGILFLWFAAHKRWWTALHWLANGIITASATYLTRLFIHSFRPLGITHIDTSYSFPSGHMTLAVAILGFAAVLLSSDTQKKYRHLIYAPVVTFTLLIGFSRLYLGAHWLTDVVGASLLGLSCVMLTTLSYRRQLVADLSFYKTLLAMLCSLLAFWGLFATFQFHKQLNNYTPIHTIHAINSQDWWTQNKSLLPLYRTNRFGKAIETLNLQWAAPLEDIRNALQKQGWQQFNNNFVSTLSRIVAKDKSQHLPVFNQLFDNRKPILVMWKKNQPDTPIIVIRFWASNYYFTDESTPLWIGSIHYRLIWEHHWQVKHNGKLNELTTPVQQVIPALTSYQWRTIDYKINFKEKKYLEDSQHQQQILLIKSLSKQNT